VPINVIRHERENASLGQSTRTPDPLWTIARNGGVHVVQLRDRVLSEILEQQGLRSVGDSRHRGYHDSAEDPA
jgi:hypothetical protein